MHLDMKKSKIQVIELLERIESDWPNGYIFILSGQKESLSLREIIEALNMKEGNDV